VPNDREADSVRSPSGKDVENPKPTIRVRPRGSTEAKKKVKKIKARLAL
jgi:hypothetical protein